MQGKQVSESFFDFSLQRHKYNENLFPDKLICIEDGSKFKENSWLILSTQPVVELDQIPQSSLHSDGKFSKTKSWNAAPLTILANKNK